MGAKKTRWKLLGKPLILLVVCVVFGIFGGTLAYYAESMSMDNPFTLGHSAVSLNEDFNPLSSFLPGETVRKEAYFQNYGQLDLLLRVYDPEKTQKWNPAMDAKKNELDPNKVIKEWGDGWGKDGAEWIKIGDYYYYKKILRAAGDKNGEDKTDFILKSLKLSPEVSNDRHGADYSDKTFTLDLQADAIPVSTYKNEWNVTAQVNKETGDVTWSQEAAQ